MSRRDRIKDLYAPPEPDRLAAANLSEEKRTVAGPVRAMGLTLDRMEADQRRLQEELSLGARVVELDPDTVDPSLVRDRFSFDGDAGFDVLRASIAEHGQEVPILVRPHPQTDGRYQIAYGHRRLRAVQSLGRKVKAVVRSMTDDELVVAQGVENSARQDLSFIEKALFASRLETHGFDRSVIMKALAVDKGEVSKLISVASAVADDLARAIGPAPKTGRRRWVALAEALKNEKQKSRAEQASRSHDFSSLDSDARFLRVLEATTIRSVPEQREWRSTDGTIRARVSQGPRSASLALDSREEGGFVAYLAGELDRLYAEFRARDKTYAGKE